MDQGITNSYGKLFVAKEKDRFSSTQLTVKTQLNIKLLLSQAL